jgi:hypothetical protein
MFGCCNVKGLDQHELTYQKQLSRNMLAKSIELSLVNDTSNIQADAGLPKEYRKEGLLVFTS